LYNKFLSAHTKTVFISDGIK